LDFLTFNRKIFWFFKFRAGKNPAKKISRQKRSGRTNFRAENFWPEKISDRTTGQRSAGIFPEVRYPSVVRPAVMRAFSNFRRDLLKNFGRESSQERKNCRHETVHAEKRIAFPGCIIRGLFQECSLLPSDFSGKVCSRQRTFL
jgi:hypothetical protein